MSRFRLWLGILFISLAAAGLLLAGAPAAAARAPSQQDELVRGALLYDNWFAALNLTPPAGSSPLWARQSSNTRSGPDTWRCVACHGWDYQGAEGAYRSGSNATGFPGLLKDGQPLPEKDILAALQGKTDPEHDFSDLGMSQSDLQALAVFLSAGAVNDNEFIDPVSLKVKDGDAEHGQALYQEACAVCHGADAGSSVVVGTQTLPMDLDGLPMGLSQIAVVDPWRFLHKTRFGTPGTPMVIGAERGWSAQDGRDVLLYVQSLAPKAPTQAEVAADRPAQPQNPGGPPNNILAGLVTLLGAMAVGLGWNLMIAGVLVVILFLIVWLLRARK